MDTHLKVGESVEFSKTIGETDKTNTLFLSHSPAAVRDVSDQLLQSMLIADRAKAS